jgi:uncharacterized protein YwqG
LARRSSREFAWATFFYAGDECSCCVLFETESKLSLEVSQLPSHEAPIVPTKTDLSALTVGELVQSFVDTILLRKTIEHIGRRNRLFDQIWGIARELKARDPMLKCLRRSLDHPVREVRFDTAAQFKNIDRVVFKKILADLAEGDDRVGFEARMYLDHVISDEKAGKDTYSEPIIDPASSSLSDKAVWQIDHPPPLAMNLDDIAHELAHRMNTEIAERVLSLARPAIGLWPQRPCDGLPITVSRLGGMPHAPPGWSWPLYETEPMFFLGQINCAELSGIPAAEKLPPSGMLAFFADHDAVNGCTRSYEGASAVFYWTGLDQLVPAQPPIELQEIFPLCALAFRPMIELPDPSSTVIKRLAWGRDDGWAYHEVREAIRDHGIPQPRRGRISQGKLFGWPNWVQYETERIGSPDAQDGLRSLLQLDSFTDGTRWAEWGRGGASLYFLIRDADLAARRFDRCEFEMQGT